MRSYVLVYILQCHLVYCIFMIQFHDAAGKAEARRASKKGLSCYYCHTLTHKELCKNVTVSYTNREALSHLCLAEERYCMVRRFSFSANGVDFKDWMFERNCTKTCTSECIMTGDRNKLQVCTSCCEDDMCNYGNKSTSVLNCGIRTLDVIISALLVFALPRKLIN